jgi:hypothetical protein
MGQFQLLSIAHPKPPYRRQEEFECHALAGPSTIWAEAAAEARYLILLFAETSRGGGIRDAKN